MRTRRIAATNSTALYLIAIAVIIVAFLLLGGGPWIRGMMYRNGSMGIANWNWATILICLGIGFILGILVSRRKR
jgi:hypothetical protein